MSQPLNTGPRLVLWKGVLESLCGRSQSSTGPWVCCHQCGIRFCLSCGLWKFDIFAVWTMVAPSTSTPFSLSLGLSLLCQNWFIIYCAGHCFSLSLPPWSQFLSCDSLILQAATDSCLCLNISASFLVSVPTLCLLWLTPFFLFHQLLYSQGQQEGRVKCSRKDSTWSSFSELPTLLCPKNMLRPRLELRKLICHFW